MDSAFVREGFRRFGVMSPLLRERISAANVEQIEDWFDRAFDAPDIDSVFESN